MFRLQPYYPGFQVLIHEASRCISSFHSHGRPCRSSTALQAGHSLLQEYQESRDLHVLNRCVAIFEEAVSRQSQEPEDLLALLFLLLLEQSLSFRFKSTRQKEDIDRAVFSHKAVVDLLEKRSAIYSDRPTTIMLHEL